MEVLDEDLDEDSTFIVATPPTGSKGSDITANAVRGNGGRVNITIQGLFGIEFRPQPTPKNDITVSSEFGLTGEFQLYSPDVDPSLRNLSTAGSSIEKCRGNRNSIGSYLSTIYYLR